MVFVGLSTDSGSDNFELKQCGVGIPSFYLIRIPRPDIRSPSDSLEVESTTSTVGSSNIGFNNMEEWEENKNNGTRQRYKRGIVFLARLRLLLDLIYTLSLTDPTTTLSQRLELYRIHRAAF